MGQVKGKNSSGGGSGTGDVVGPGSATDENVAVFDTTTGKLIKDGGKTVAEILTDGTPAGTAVTSAGGGSTKFLKETVGGGSEWSVPSGSGDVVGPGSSTDDNIATFHETTGKIIQDGAKTIATVQNDATPLGTAVRSPGGSALFLKEKSDGNSEWSTPGGGGDVTGPGSVTLDSNIAIYNGTTGKIIKDSTKTIADVITDAIPDHNTTTSIQGGTTAQFYHLTLAAYDFLKLQDQAVLIASSPTFANLTTTGYASTLNFTDSSHYTGFPNRTDTSIGFADAGAIFTLTSGAGDKAWIDGVEYDISSLSTIALPSGEAAPTGLYWIWITAPGGTPQLNVNTTFPGFEFCLTATVYWNTVSNSGLLSDERHWFGRDKQWHEMHHETIGAAYASGMAGVFSSTTTFSMGAGEFYDEDIEHSNGAETVCTVLYHDVDAAWVWDAASTTPYKEVTGIIQYQNVYALANVTTNKYVNYWVYMSPDPTDPVHSIMGVEQHTLLSQARDEGLPSFPALPSADNLFIYKVTYQNIAGTTTWIETTDFRGSAGTGSAGYVPTDHGGLSGLADDDHPQYGLANVTTVGGTGGADEWTEDTGRYWFTVTHGWIEVMVQVDSDFAGGGTPKLIIPDEVDYSVAGDTKVWLGIEPVGDTKIKLLRLE